MKPLPLAWLAAVTGLLLMTSSAPAQYGRSAGGGPYAYGRPGLSPYLNLLRGGNPATNYYLGVLPELDRRANTTLFRSELDLLSQPTPPPKTPEELLPSSPGTGHPAYFMYYGSYYNFGGGRPATNGRPGR